MLLVFLTGNYFLSFDRSSNVILADLYFHFYVVELYSELNYHNQKTLPTPTQENTGPVFRPY